MEGISHYRRSLTTDASKKTTGRVGAAFVDTDRKFVGIFSLPPHTSILSGELQAILQAVKYAANTGTDDRWLIVSDSLSSLKAIKNRLNETQEVREILEIITKATQRGSAFRLAWVPSRSGITVNEQADLCADTARRLGRRIVERLPPSAFFPLIKETSRSDWQNQWNMGEKGRRLFSISP